MKADPLLDVPTLVRHMEQMILGRGGRLAAGAQGWRKSGQRDSYNPVTRNLGECAGA